MRIIIEIDDKGATVKNISAASDNSDQMPAASVSDAAPPEVLALAEQLGALSAGPAASFYESPADAQLQTVLTRASTSGTLNAGVAQSPMVPSPGEPIIPAVISGTEIANSSIDSLPAGMAMRPITSGDDDSSVVEGGAPPTN
ncbi:MAG: hypothetical protein GC179_06770 [Anaerolineaceae bacterium]|nr:hypothetical protein [Anaerolineaceae bacterium]